MQQSESLVGQPMVFLLIEKLKEHLELFNDCMNEGSFIMLSDELVVKVFNHLSPKELARMAMVNKNFKRLSEEALV